LDVNRIMTEPAKVSPSYHSIPHFKTLRARFGIKLTGKWLAQWRLEPRLGRARLRGDRVRESAPSPEALTRSGQLSAGQDFSAHPRLSEATRPERFATIKPVSTPAAAVLPEAVVPPEAHEKASISSDSASNLPPLKGANRPSPSVGNWSQKPAAGSSQSKVYQSSVAATGDVVSDVPVADNESKSKNTIPIRLSTVASDDRRVPSPGLVVRPGADMADSTQAFTEPLISKPIGNTTFPTASFKSRAIAAGVTTKPRLDGNTGPQYQTPSPDENIEPGNATNNSASTTDSGTVTGELWLDTLSLRDWVRTYLNEEMARATHGGNLTAGVL